MANPTTSDPKQATRHALDGNRRSTPRNGWAT